MFDQKTDKTLAKIVSNNNILHLHINYSYMRMDQLIDATIL